MIQPSLILDVLIHLELLKSCIVQREKRIEARPHFSDLTEPRFSGLPYRGPSMAGLSEEKHREDLGWVGFT